MGKIILRRCVQGLFCHWQKRNFLALGIFFLYSMSDSFSKMSDLFEEKGEINRFFADKECLFFLINFIIYFSISTFFYNTFFFFIDYFFPYFVILLNSSSRLFYSLNLLFYPRNFMCRMCHGCFILIAFMQTIYYGHCYVDIFFRWIHNFWKNCIHLFFNFN